MGVTGVRTTRQKEVRHVFVRIGRKKESMEEVACPASDRTAHPTT